MAVVISGSLIGLVYVGNWKNEPLVTVKHYFNEWHVCVKEIQGESQKKNVYYKRIVAVVESELLAKIVADMIVSDRALLTELRSNLPPAKILT